MPISAKIDPQLNAEDEFLDLKDCLSVILLCTDLKANRCLRYIDPYGTTIFNHLQLLDLLEDLQSITQSDLEKAQRRAAEQYKAYSSAFGFKESESIRKPDDGRSYLDARIAFIKRAIDAGYHTDVKFIGG